jgi:hypothetical protein
MSLLRRTRTEMAGAWRSLRYDLGRAPARPPAGGPDVTSTGMGTWSLDGLVEQAGPDPAPPARRPRRAVAVTAFGALTVVGAAAAYLAVVNGLGSLMGETTAAAGTFPPRVVMTTGAGVAPPTRPVTPPRSPVATRRATTAAVLPPPPEPPAAAVPPPTVERTSPIRTAATNQECRCRPPVPTPTAPTSSPSPTPSPSPSESASPSPDPSPSEAADPSESPSPSRSWDSKRHRQHH